MSAVIQFPDVELICANYLRTTLAAHGHDNVFVSNRRETQATAVWLRRDGGPQLDAVREAPRLGVNIFAPSEQAATDLARLVSALLVAAPNGTPICKSTQAVGPSPVADASGPRRFMSFDLVVRGTLL